jgi:hypothetical protein
MGIKHLIITRFNLNIWGRDKLNNITLGEDWLEQRFCLFEQYCLPSVLSQSDKNFMWLCFFDAETPTKYLQKINTYHNSIPELKSVFLTESEGFDNYNSIIKKTILNEFNSAKNDISITTRLDNDDSIHIDFVKRLNQIAVSTKYKDQFCVFEYGYQYFATSNFITRIKYPNNHFTSRIEKELTDINDIKTVLAIKHSHLRKKNITENFYVNKIIDKRNPFWIEVIHERNVANDLFLSFRIKDISNFILTKIELKNRKLSEFGLDIYISKKNQAKKYFTFYLPELFKKVKRKLIQSLK